MTSDPIQLQPHQCLCQDLEVPPLPQQLTDETQKDSIHATPFWHKCNQVIPQHFDTALVHDALEAEDIGLKGESRFKPQYATKLMHPQGYRVTYV